MNKNHVLYGPSKSCYPGDREAEVKDADNDSPDVKHGGRTIDKLREQLNEYLTRRQAAQYIRDILGRPFSFSTASKLAAQGEFAQPAMWWGRRPLYTRDDLRAWAEARSRPVKERA
jgi:hypothetical protein